MEENHDLKPSSATCQLDGNNDDKVNLSITSSPRQGNAIYLTGLF